MSERLRIGLPTGESEKDALSFTKAIGLEFPEPGRRYLIPVLNMPIDFVVLRASDIPSVVYNPESSVAAGITGSDIIWEAGMDPQSGQKLPFNRILGKERISSLFVGVTEGFRQKMLREQGREPLAADLARQMIITKFPFVTRSLFSERGIPDPQVKAVQGKTEAMQYVYWNAYGLVDVVDTGGTIRANQIQELERFHDVTIRIIENEEN